MTADPDVPHEPLREGEGDGLNVQPVNLLGMDLLEVRYKGVEAHFGEGEDWITLYLVSSANEGRGEVQEMLRQMMQRCGGKKFGGSIALCPAMRHIYQKLEIMEYAEE